MHFLEVIHLAINSNSNIFATDIESLDPWYRFSIDRRDQKSRLAIDRTMFKPTTVCLSCISQKSIFFAKICKYGILAQFFLSSSSLIVFKDLLQSSIAPKKNPNAPNIEPQLTLTKRLYFKNLSQIKFQNWDARTPRTYQAKFFLLWNFWSKASRINHLLCNRVCTTIQNCAYISVMPKRNKFDIEVVLSRLMI